MEDDRASYQKNWKAQKAKEGMKTLNTTLSIDATAALYDLQERTGWKFVQIVNQALIAVNENPELILPAVASGEDTLGEAAQVVEEMDQVTARMNRLEERLAAVEKRMGIKKLHVAEPVAQEPAADEPAEASPSGGWIGLFDR